MTCARCDKPGKNFTNWPSRKRDKFLEPLCKACLKLAKYEEAIKQPTNSR